MKYEIKANKAMEIVMTKIESNHWNKNHNRDKRINLNFTHGIKNRITVIIAKKKGISGITHDID